MYRFVTVFLCLTLTLVVNSDFCGKYKSLATPPNSTPNLKFIATKAKHYLYLKDSKEFVYEFDVSCNSSDNCPKIGSEQELSSVFVGLTKLKWAFIQDGFTYLFTESSTKVYKFENTNKVEEIEENDFWKNITHSVAYEWAGNTRTVLSRFIPPHSPKGRPIYSYSIDLVRIYSVELFGNYEMVNVVRDTLTTIQIYSFGDYLVPMRFDGYLPLPNGDDIFNYVVSPVYTHKDKVSLTVYEDQNLHQLLGCQDVTIGEHVLSDTRNEYLYPNTYFKRHYPE